MRILIAPNAFKGSLSVLEACTAFAKGAREAAPAASLDLMPIADGGDGLMDCLIAAKGGRVLHAGVTGPMGDRIRAPFALLNDGSACVEMARASGLALVEGPKRPLEATSRGTGELIAAAAAAGAKRIVVGLGGTASSDGGAGMAQALGVRLLDAEGRELPAGVGALPRLDRVEGRVNLPGVEFLGISDVTNPLLGLKGSAAIFGPQKGATPSQVRLIEKALKRYALILKRDLGMDVSKRPGAGAAGGFGTGFMAFLGGKLVPGAAYVLESAGAAKRLRSADALLTGEGRLDSTSFFGKAPVELAKLAKGVKTAFVCGDIDPAVKRRLKAVYVSLGDAGATKAQSMRSAGKWAAKAAAMAVRGLSLTALLVLPAFAADWAEIDRLYLHRHEGSNLEKSQELLEKAKDEPEAAWRLARGLVRRGERQAAKKDRLADFKTAAQEGERGVKLSSGSAEAHFWLGVAYGRQGQATGLMKSLKLVGPIRKSMERTLELDPKHGGAHNVLGELYWQLPGFAGGDKKKALRHFEQALELSPEYSANYVPLAEVYAKLGRKQDALKVLSRLFQLKSAADPAQLDDDTKDGRALHDELEK